MMFCANPLEWNCCQGKQSAIHMGVNSSLPGVSGDNLNSKTSSSKESKLLLHDVFKQSIVSRACPSTETYTASVAWCGRGH